MAIISSNNLGRLKKKSGPNIFRKWRNLQVMAVYTSEVSNPRTQRQVLNRLRLSGASAVARGFASPAMIGFENVCAGTKVPQRCMFIKKNIGHVHADTSSGYTVDYEDLILSEGVLPEVQFANATFENPLQVDVPINDSASVLGTHRDDKVFVFVYSPEAQTGILSDTGVRVDEEVSVHVPAYWNGHRVHVWGFAKGADANELNPKVLSHSRYLGSGTIS